MTEHNLKTALVGFSGRRPFRPFLIEFMSGDRLRVAHSEAVTFREHALIHRNPAGEFRVFDSGSVCQLLDPPPAAVP